MGRDEMNKLTSGGASKFQPTRPHGARQNHVRSHRRPNRVSTHAPAWGATYNLVNREAIQWFQPTRPHGARRRLDCYDNYDDKFQPTRPHGARPRPNFSFRLTYMFQPTRPHGARPSDTLMSIRADKFQPTRPHGARHAVTNIPYLWMSVSTHAPAWGATPRGRR